MNLKYWKEQFENNPTNEEFQKNYYKACYEMFLAAGWCTKSINLEEFGITAKELKENSRIYACQYLNMSKDEYLEQVYRHNGKNQKDAQRPDSKYNLMLEKLIHIPIENTEEIIQTIKATNVNFYYLNLYISNFVIGYYPNEKEKIESILRRKTKVYVDYVKAKNIQQQQDKKEQQLQEKLLTAKFYVRSFIESPETTESAFCQKIYPPITEKQFQYLLKLVKKHDAVLYQKHLEKIQTIKRRNYIIQSQRVQEIFQLFKYGIPVNDTIREFDIIDYYTLTNLSFNSFRHMIKENISKEELLLLNKFFNKNESAEKTLSNEITRIKNEEKIIDCQKDENGIPIRDTGRLITEEEKEAIINFLKQNELPVNYKLYSVALNRYLNGSLDLSAPIINKKLMLQLLRKD